MCIPWMDQLFDSCFYSCNTFTPSLLDTYVSQIIYNIIYFNEDFISFDSIYLTVEIYFRY